MSPSESSSAAGMTSKAAAQGGWAHRASGRRQRGGVLVRCRRPWVSALTNKARACTKACGLRGIHLGWLNTLVTNNGVSRFSRSCAQCMLVTVRKVWLPSAEGGYEREQAGSVLTCPQDA
eukprot:4969831-Pyramimonas_sp.AAC.1